MANAVYDPFKEGILGALYDLDTAAVKVALVRNYTFNPVHGSMLDVTTAGGIVNGTSAALTNPSITGGVFDADDTSITTTASAVDHFFVVFQASAVGGGGDVSPAAQKTIAFFDTGSGLPVQPGNGSVTITWANTTNKILKVG